MKWRQMKCREKWERTGQDRDVRNGGGEASGLMSPPDSIGAKAE